MNEEMMTTGSTPGAAGFSGKAAATGPTAGFDPILKFRKKVQKRKKKIKEDNEIDRPITVNRVNPAPRSRLLQYKCNLPGVGETVVYANSPAELSQKLRLLINPRYRGDIKIERILPAEAGKFFMNKRNSHMRNVQESDDKSAQQAIVQQKTALEKKKVLMKKQALQKQLQSKVQDLKKKARVGGAKGEADS